LVSFDNQITGFLDRNKIHLIQKSKLLLNLKTGFIVKHSLLENQYRNIIMILKEIKRQESFSD
jgi:hypothetical protein